MNYKTDEPRIAVRSPYNYDTGTGDRQREIGQASAMGEALFFLALGYRVEIYRWNGKIFEHTENFCPGDVEPLWGKLL